MSKRRSGETTDSPAMSYTTATCAAESSDTTAVLSATLCSRRYSEEPWARGHFILLPRGKCRYNTTEWNNTITSRCFRGSSTLKEFDAESDIGNQECPGLRVFVLVVRFTFWWKGSLQPIKGSQSIARGARIAAGPLQRLNLNPSTRISAKLRKVRPSISANCFKQIISVIFLVHFYL